MFMFIFLCCKIQKQIKIQTQNNNTCMLDGSITIGKKKRIKKTFNYELSVRYTHI